MSTRARSALLFTAVALFAFTGQGAAADVQDTRAYLQTFGSAPSSVPHKKLLWPVKPFARPVPIRSTFGEPRSIVMDRHGLKGYAFHEYLYSLNQVSAPGRRMIHDGIDLVIPRGTLVYSLENGRARLGGIKPFAAWVQVGNFRYEHIRSLVKPGQKVIAFKTPIGRIITPDHHLHLTRYHRGKAINPLAFGGFVGYKDMLAPRVSDPLFYGADGVRLDPANLSGRIAIAVKTSDPQSQAPLAPLTSRGLIKSGQLRDLRLFGPATHAGTGVYGLSYAIEDELGTPVMGPYDVYRADGIVNQFIGDRLYTVASNRNDFVHHIWTRLSLRSPDGDGYLDTGMLAPGNYRVRVAARDVVGNLTTEFFPITIAPR